MVEAFVIHPVCSWSPDPTVRNTVWGFLIGYSALWVRYYGLEQSSVQRYSATETITKSRR